MSLVENRRQEKTLADYLDVVRRYKWLIVLTALVVPLVAYFLSAQQPKVYRATSEVLLNRQDLGSVLGLQQTNQYTDLSRYAATQAALSRVPEVTRDAIARAGVTMDPSELVGRSVVTPRGNTDLLTFSVSHGDPAVAAALSSAYAAAFTSYKYRMETASFKQARKELLARLAELRRAGASDTTTYRELVEKSQDLRTLELLQAPAIVVRAARGAGQVEPTPTRNAILGAMLGLMLGLGGAFALSALDRRIRDAEEIERELRIPLLARLPGPRSRHDSLLILERPSDEVTEAVSRMRANFDFANRELGARLVMVTSAGPGEGKSTTAANLAVALARSGRHVVLVDLDLRRPALARMFRLRDLIGVTDAATGSADLDAALNRIPDIAAPSWLPAARRTETGTGVLEVLTAGKTHVDPSEFVESVGLSEVLHRVRSRAEIVLIDASPILATGDAMALTAKVDGVLLVNRLGTVTLPTLRDLGRALQASPAPTLGLVATGATTEETHYYVAYREDEKPPTAVAKLPKAPRQPKIAPTVTPAPEGEAASGRWARPTR
jgi:non-specific protein-tyrosine kinase